MISRGAPKLPQWYLDEPVAPEGAEFYFRAFWDLSTERQIGMALGPIPTSRIMHYAEMSGLEEDVSRAFLEAIREMDSAFMKWNSSEAGRLSKYNKKHG